MHLHDIIVFALDGTFQSEASSTVALERIFLIKLRACSFKSLDVAVLSARLNPALTDWESLEPNGHIRVYLSCSF